MPTYVAQCPSCGHIEDFIRKVDDRDNTPEHCGASMHRTLVAPQVSAMAFTGHKGFVLGGNTWIESGADYKRYLAKNNMMPASEGHREADIQAANKERERDAARRNVVEDTVRSLG